MKKLLFSLLLIPSLIFAQSDTAIQYKELVSVEGATKEQLLQNATGWFDETFKGLKLSLQNVDTVSGEITGKGVMEAQLEAAGKQVKSVVNFNLRILIIKGRYLFQVSDFVHQYLNEEFTGFGLLTSSMENPVKQPNYSKQLMNELWLQAKQDVALRVEPLMDRLQVTMKKKEVVQ
jgi:hypothetical protein